MVGVSKQAYLGKSNVCWLLFFFFSEPPSFGTSYLTDQSIKHDIDRRIAERPDLLETANMKRGDVLFFNQYVYHRGKCKKFVCLLELAFLCFHR